MLPRLHSLVLAAAALLTPLTYAAPYIQGQPSNSTSASDQPSVVPGVSSQSAAANIPDYVKQYAPVLWLYSKEKWFPSLLQKHIDNSDATIDYAQINTQTLSMPLTCDNLDQLNVFGKGTNVYLTAKVNPAINGDTQPWLFGEKPVNGKSAAPVTTIIVDKGNGVVDAFWMFFYSYNKGTTIPIINKEFGDHVGDWEHMMIRFQNGVPQTVYTAQHARGQAFTYKAMEKYTGGQRPVAYVASGTHATYSTVGSHDHAIPLPFNLPAGFVVDKTDKGTLWDPLLTQPMYYWWDAKSAQFSAAAENPELPVSWLNFVGLWGDKAYPNGAKGQYELFGQRKWDDGPTGPTRKNLNRTRVCPDGEECVILPIRTLKKRYRS